MTMKNKSILAISLFTCLIITSCANQEINNTKPNIILIAADDLGWSDIGCYGSEINTPNIDRLATEGMRFTQFYNTSKCFPSRASLITGVYPQDCGYDETHTNSLKNAVTIGEVLQDAGYLTYWSGKHHGKDNPYDRGFNHYFGLKDGASNHFNPGEQRSFENKPAQKKNNRVWCDDSKVYQPFTPKDSTFYTTDSFTDYALDYINEAEQLSKPFFLYVAYTAPHDPLMAWPDDIKKYEGVYDNGYQNIREKRYQKQLKLGVIDSSYMLSQHTYASWDSLSEKEQRFEADKMEVYAAMIDRLDQNVGRILEKLKELNLDKNTIILFASDNGASAEMVLLKDDDENAKVGSMGRWVSLGENWANVSNTPFRYYKNYSFEGGIRTPLIAYWPNNIKANSFSKFPGHFIDFMATFIDVSDAEYPTNYNDETITPMRGISLLPAFMGKSLLRNDALYWRWHNGSAVRMANWKLVKHGIESSWDLYNIEEDPSETLNLAKEMPNKVNKLDSVYNVWISQYNE